MFLAMVGMLAASSILGFSALSTVFGGQSDSKLRTLTELWILKDKNLGGDLELTGSIGAVKSDPCCKQLELAVSDEVKAVEGLLRRFLPHLVGFFDFRHLRTAVTPFFSVRVKDGRVIIEGTSGVELASGLHWFLKYFCNSSFSWEVTGGLQLDSKFQDPANLRLLEGKEKVVVERSVPYSYYQNIVTVSYSMAFWDWDRWEQEIDWMALQGVNLPLAPVGIEYVWLKTYEELGLTAEDLKDFFPGPAFIAWGRMGNIQGYGGPLPLAYMEKQAELQKKIVERMRSFGMTPVFPAFAGFVPRALATKMPEARVSTISNWCHFPDQYCCPCLLDATDPLFKELGSMFIRNLRRMYGWDAKGFYVADTFNEMKPTSSDPAYLSNISATVYEAMTEEDPSSVWLMQAWLFFSDQRFWQPPQIQALLRGVPKGSLILLDLFAEEHPVWERTESFYGYPFIWCMLHNFGGNLEMYGALSQVQGGVHRALQRPNTCVGIGMAPEGLEQNPVVYEFMAEMAFSGRPEVDLKDWFYTYSQRRYAGAVEPHLQDAWDMLVDILYTCQDRLHNTVCDIPTSRPGLSSQEIMGWGLRPHLWYNLRDLLAAWEQLLDGSGPVSSLSSFQYDLVDVSREYMSKLSGELWQGIVSAYLLRDLETLRCRRRLFLELLSDMDTLLGSHPAFLLGRFLKRAREYGETEEQANLFEHNARTQVTIWGTSIYAGDSEVSDYANKEWSGLISGFYVQRWRMWLDRLEEDLTSGYPYDMEGWRRACLDFVYRWVDGTETYPVKPSGNAVLLSRRMFEKYGPLVAPPAELMVE